MDKLTEAVEQGSIFADLLLASTPRTLLKRLGENKLLQEARQKLLPLEAEKHLERAITLYEEPVPEGYAHPHDLAIAAYIYLVEPAITLQARDFLQRLVSEGRQDIDSARTVATVLLSEPSVNEFAVASAKTREVTEVR